MIDVPPPPPCRSVWAQLRAELTRVDIAGEARPVPPSLEGCSAAVRVVRLLSYRLDQLLWRISPSGFVRGLLGWALRCLAILAVPLAVVGLLLGAVQAVVASIAGIVTSVTGILVFLGLIALVVVIGRR